MYYKIMSNTFMHSSASKALNILFKKDGISEGRLAKLTGVTQPTIHRILTGEVKEPRTSNLMKLAKYYGVPRSVFDTGIVDVDGPKMGTPTKSDIEQLLSMATPRSKKALEKINQAVEEGKLTEQQIELLESIADHLMKK